MPVSSPFNQRCEMNPASGLCEGCRRTLDEIIHWSDYTEAQQRAVLQSLKLRAWPPRREKD